MTDWEALKAEIRLDWDFHAKWREEAREDYDFFHGDQWEATAKAEMLDQERVPLVFNRVAPIIHAVAGAEISNRTEVRFIPRTIGDAKVNEALTEGARWFRDSAGAEEEESIAFMDTLICGIGATETALDFESDAEGEPVVMRFDPITAGWDRNATRKGLNDAVRVFRVLDLPMAEAEGRFPGHDRRDYDAAWIDTEVESGDPHVRKSGDQWKGEATGADGETSTVRIVQVQWCERERFVDLVDPATQQRKTLPRADFDKLAKVMPQVAQLPHRSVVKKVWRQAFIGGKVLNENRPCEDGPTLKFITGHFNRRTKRWYGLLKPMKDPQAFANKWMSNVLHIINANSKGGLLIESDATDDIRTLEDSWAAADAVHVLRPGGLDKIKEKKGAEFPAAMMALTEQAITAIRDVTGVNLEILGMREANQPGVLEYQRRQSAMTTLAGLFDALRFYRKDQGRVILWFLRKHIAPTGRLVRIVQDGEPSYQPLDIGDDTVTYDVIVDDAPTSPNQKEQTWGFIQSLMPILGQAGLSGNMWATILEHSPLPESLVEKLRAEVEKANKEPDPMQQQAAQLELRKLASEAAENEASAALDMARAQQLGVEAQLAPVRMATEAQGVQQRQQMDMAKLAQAASRASSDGQLKREQMQLQALRGLGLPG